MTEIGTEVPLSAIRASTPTGPPDTYLSSQRLGTRERDYLWQRRQAVVAMLDNIVQHVNVFLLYRMLNLAPFTGKT